MSHEMSHIGQRGELLHPVASRKRVMANVASAQPLITSSRATPKQNTIAYVILLSRKHPNAIRALTGYVSEKKKTFPQNRR
jgi:hypothetical protein